MRKKKSEFSAKFFRSLGFTAAGSRQLAEHMDTRARKRLENIECSRLICHRRGEVRKVIEGRLHWLCKRCAKELAGWISR